MNFTSAAESLFVTQTAISHQVRTLEDYLGVPLFRRVGRNLMLTDEGRRLLPAVTDGLDRLEAITGQMKSGPSARMVTALIPHDLCSVWLGPRLPAFWESHPNVDLRIHEAVRTANFARDDLAIYWGRGVWPDLESTLLLESEYTVVCGNALSSLVNDIGLTRALTEVTLLHKDDFDLWSRLIAHLSVVDRAFPRGSVFGEITALLTALERGRGLAVMRSVFVADALREGRLVSLATVNLEPDRSYYIVHPAGERRERVLLFKAFLLNIAADLLP